MINISEIEDELKRNSKLDSSLNELLDLVLRTNQFQFKEDQISFDTSVLKEKLILVEQGVFWKISDSRYFLFKFYNQFKTHLGFSISDDVESSFQFVEQIENELGNATGNSGRYEFMRYLRGFLLYLMNKAFGSDFNSYVLTLKKGTQNRYLYDFNSAFCLTLPSLELPNAILFENLKHLLNELIVPDAISGDTGRIVSTIRKIASANIVRGKEFLEFSLKCNPQVPDINIGIFGGIYEIQRGEFRAKLAELYSESTNEVEVLCTLANIKALSNEEALENIALIHSKDEWTEIGLLNLSRFYSSLIDNANISDELIKTTAFEKLEELIVNPNQKVRNCVLNELRFLENHDVEIVKLLKVLIHSSDFDKKQIKFIGEIFVKHKELSSFFDFIEAYGTLFKLDFPANVFSSTYYYFINSDPINFSRELIRLITNDKGEIRFIGNQIIASFSTLRTGHFKFVANILDLNAVTQYKLWASVLAEMREPKVSLPMLLPLLDSKFGFVKESFISKLEELTESYHGSVLKEMESELDIKKTPYKEIYERIKTYHDSFCKKIDLKRGIKELDPYYTQSKLINQYRENYGKSFRQKMDAEVRENSILSLIATTIILAKGGGWKSEGHDKMSQLSTISHSMMLPRIYFVAPEYFDIEHRINNLSDWGGILKRWEATISL